jgi:hypothetical protein
MPVPKIPSGWGGESAYVHFKYVGTPCGKRWQAWVAGPTVWIVGHTKGRTKPCLDVMTGGCLLCSRCAQIEPPKKVGYVPLYRMSDAKPVVVIVYEEEEQYTDRLVTHQGVTVAREIEQSDSIFVRAIIGDYPSYKTTLHVRQRAVDCTQSLLAMWAIPEWTAWCRGSFGQAMAAPPTPTPEPTTSSGVPFDPMHKAAARRWADPPVVEQTDDSDGTQAALDRALLRKTQASTNGKHKPPPKG